MPTDPALARALTDPARLSSVADTGLMDAPARPILDRYVKLVRLILGVPVALVSLVDSERQFFASHDGLPEPWATRGQTPLSYSFCKHVVGEARRLVVEDSAVDERVRGNLAVTELGVAAYAGCPIRTTDGRVLGSFCAIDDRPRRWTPRELEILELLTQSVSDEIEFRKRALRAETSERELAAVNDSLLATGHEVSGGVRAAVHDMRSPLSVLALAVQHLLSHDAARSFPELSRLLATMRRNVDHASSLLGSMQTIAQLAAEPDAGPTPPLDVGAVAEQVCHDLREPDGPTLVLDVVAPDARICLDETSMRRCLENLVTNATRFARAQILVTVRRREDEIVVTVDDDGEGLPSAAAYRRVWRLNVRFHEDTGKSGSGLGLSIVKGIVEGAEGYVRARSSPTLGGARFTLVFPSVD